MAGEDRQSLIVWKVEKGFTRLFSVMEKIGVAEGAKSASEAIVVMDEHYSFDSIVMSAGGSEMWVTESLPLRLRGKCVRFMRGQVFDQLPWMRSGLCGDDGFSAVAWAHFLGTEYYSARFAAQRRLKADGTFIYTRRGFPVFGADSAQRAALNGWMGAMVLLKGVQSVA